MSQDSSVQGGCFCGAVRYEAQATALLGSMVCHCRTCRRVAGAPAVAWVTFSAQRFRFTQGQPAAFNSSPGVRRTFCPACGTPLTYALVAAPSELDVTTCSLDHPEAFPPTHHSWLSHNLPWLRFGDGLPAYPESRSDDSP